MLKVRLEPLEFSARHSISERLLENAVSQDMVLNIIVRRTVNALTGAIHILGKTHIPAHFGKLFVCEYPETWLDAFKLRWFPRWALARWPAKRAKRYVRGAVVYPKVVLPREQTGLTLYVHSDPPLGLAGAFAEPLPDLPTGNATQDHVDSDAGLFTVREKYLLDRIDQLLAVPDRVAVDRNVRAWANGLQAEWDAVKQELLNEVEGRL